MEHVTSFMEPVVCANDERSATPTDGRNSDVLEFHSILFNLLFKLFEILLITYKLLLHGKIVFDTL